MTQADAPLRHSTGRGCGSHTRYGLTCKRYDDLIEWAGRRCQICSDDGAMVIDHDHGVGPWAVRGILCAHCNAFFHLDTVVSAADRHRYLAAPWYAAHPDHPVVPTERVPTAEAARLYEVLDSLTGAFKLSSDASARRRLRRGAGEVGIALLQQGEMPSRVVARAPFSDGHLRSLARAVGVPPARPGHKIGSRPYR